MLKDYEVEISFDNNWLNLWLETDSKFTMMAFKNSALIP